MKYIDNRSLALIRCGLSDYESQLNDKSFFMSCPKCWTAIANQAKGFVSALECCYPSIVESYCHKVDSIFYRCVIIKLTEGYSVYEIPTL